jgi:hypothetical protein
MQKVKRKTESMGGEINAWWVLIWELVKAERFLVEDEPLVGDFSRSSGERRGTKDNTASSIKR